MNLIPGIEEFTISFAPAAEPDLSGYEIFAVPAAELSDGDFVPSATNRVYKGPDTSVTVKAAPGQWCVKAAAYDVFGDTGLNYTPLMTVVVLSRISDLLETLAGQITEDQLYQSLVERIDLIDAPVTGLVDMTDALRTEVEDPDTGLKVQTAQLVQDIHDPDTGLIKQVDAVEVTINDPDTGLVRKFDVLDATINDPATGVIAKMSGLDATINDPATGVVAKQVELEQVVLDPATGLAKVQSDLQATVNDDHAALQVEQSVRAAVTAPEWAAGSYPRGATVMVAVAGKGYLFQSKIDGNSAVPTVTGGVAVETAEWKPVTANLYAQMLLKTDVNGHITGIGMANDGATGEVMILADVFKVVNPGQPDQAKQVFVVGTIDGQPAVGIDGTLVLDGTLVVGGNVQMGPNAVIQWSNLSEESRTNLTGPQGPTGPTGQTGPTGPAGADGLSIVWKGSLSAAPASPLKNWAYRNSSTGYVYIYTGTAWTLMVTDGNDGTAGAAGADGLSVFITYNDNALSSAPAVPTGDGTTNGWHTAPTSSVVWLSQKVAASASSGTWGAPIPIKGAQGDTGPAGPTGPTGPAGPTPDMTAYMDKATWVTQVGADYLFTGKIAVDNLVGNTITSKTIQTAASGQRFVVDSATNLAKFYDSNGVVKVTMGANSANGTTSYATFGNGAGSTVSLYAWSGSAAAVSAYSAGFDCIVGQSGKADGAGVSGSGYYGVKGSSSANAPGAGVYGNCGSGYGVYGTSQLSDGVRGDSYSAAGVHGVSTSGGGVFGESTTGVGMQGNSNSYHGVVGANLDGTKYDFYAAGSGSNYGPFTGSHDVLVALDFPGVPGDIVCDKEMLIKRSISTTLAVVGLAAVPKLPSVLGVLSVVMAQDDPHVPSAAAGDEDLLLQIAPYKFAIVNALGEGQINVCKDGGDIEPGDYLCSSARPGKGMRQEDDLLHNYTVAKARESVTWSETEDDIRTIACTYHCG